MQNRSGKRWYGATTTQTPQSLSLISLIKVFSKWTFMDGELCTGMTPAYYLHNADVFVRVCMVLTFVVENRKVIF